MTVSELKAILDRYPDNMPVTIRQYTHDYWNTVRADSVDTVEIVDRKWSNYHRSFVIVDECDDQDDPKSTVLIIR
jgi:hypothetical protein